MQAAITGAVPAPLGAPATPATAPAPPAGRRRLFNRWADFLLLGGGSIVVMGAIALFFPEDEAWQAALATAMLLLAHFVNHPHFAHSYQIFYRGFARKAFSLDSPLRHRYRFAGVLVPVLLVVFFAVTLARGDVALLGLAANVMFFTVGWHYAKQGYGILMVDAAHRGIRLGADERRRLLWNTHLAWPTWWLMANDELAKREFWGLTYYLLDVPDPILHAMLAAVAISSLLVARDLFRRWRGGAGLPANGIVAYVAALYVWMPLARLDPAVLLVAPLFHSLQYLGVVWRYQLSVEADRLHRRDAERSGGGGGGSGASRWPRWLRSAPAGLARFIVAGTILGAAGFWLAPVTLDTLTGYDRALFGGTVFLFMAWTFINIHHYFLDNVMWRRENPEIRRHLLGAGAQPGRPETGAAPGEART